MDFEIFDDKVVIEGREITLSDQETFGERLAECILAEFKSQYPYPRDYYNVDLVGEYGTTSDEMLSKFLEAAEGAREEYLTSKSHGEINHDELNGIICDALIVAYEDCFMDGFSPLEDAWYDFKREENIEDLFESLSSVVSIDPMMMDDLSREAVTDHLHEADTSSIWDVVRGDLKIAANITYNPTTGHSIASMGDFADFVQENITPIKTLMQYCKDDGKAVARSLLYDYGVDPDNLEFGLPIVGTAGDLQDSGILTLLWKINGLLQLKGNPEKGIFSGEQVYQLIEETYSIGGNLYVAGKWDVSDIIRRSPGAPITVKGGLFGLFEGMDGSGLVEYFDEEIEIPISSHFASDNEVGIDKCFGFVGQVWRSTISVEKLQEEKPARSFALTG